MSDIYKEALNLHEKNKGKIEVVSKVPVKTAYDLTLAYSPGVAKPCLEIKNNVNNVYKYTSKQNLVAVITDGTAVLGLGDIGPEAALPVMEGKAILFKTFGNVDAFPICLDTKDPEEIIKTCKLLAPGLGGINLEDISGPRCVTIERRLKEELDIPVFHDDQHGTAIVTTAALINALRLTGKKKEDLKIIVNGTGAAGSSIIKMLHQFGVKDILAFDSKGCLCQKHKDRYDFLKLELLEIVNKENIDVSLAEAFEGADVFVGVSVADCVTKEMVASMNKDPFIFALSNPNPEIKPELALEAGAKIVGTGRSDYPNQINNVLAFPGLFRGALDAKAKKITEEMKLAAAYAIANIIEQKELRSDYIIPSPFDERVAKEVAKAVMKCAKDANICRE